MQKVQEKNTWNWKNYFIFKHVKQGSPNDSMFCSWYMQVTVNSPAESNHCFYCQQTYWVPKLLEILLKVSLLEILVLSHVKVSLPWVYF